MALCKVSWETKSNVSLYRLHQQYPAFGTGVRLCKRWVSAHLLSNHVTDEAVELMVAHLFTCPAPYSIPGCVQYSCLTLKSIAISYIANVCS